MLGCTLHWYKDGSGRGVDRPFLCSQAMILLEAVMNEEFARLTSLAVLLTVLFYFYCNGFPRVFGLLNCVDV